MKPVEEKTVGKKFGLIRKLLADERGFASAFSLILVTVIICIGAIVGLTCLRDQITQEFGDVAVALDNVDQSFSAFIYVGDPNKVDPPCLGMEYLDNPATLVDPVDAPPACLILSTPPSGENGTPATPSGIFP